MRVNTRVCSFVADRSYYYFQMLEAFGSGYLDDLLSSHNFCRFGMFDEGDGQPRSTFTKVDGR